MILPTLRGYEVNLEQNAIVILCETCRVQHILYRSRRNPRRRQSHIPAYCAKCDSLILGKVTASVPSRARQQPARRSPKSRPSNR